MSGQVKLSLDRLQASIVDQLQQALAMRERASLLVSGGSSPAPLYQRLAKCDLPWERIDVGLVDERWVAIDHPRSNERFIRETLIQHRAANARLIGMYTGHHSPQEALARVDAAYRSLPQPFDVTILGMGPDGHFASLFPHAQGLLDALDPDSKCLCAAINAQPSHVTGEETQRMSLSLAGILNSRAIYLMISDRTKLARYCEALSPGGDTLALPLRALLQQRRLPVHIFQQVEGQ